MPRSTQSTTTQTQATTLASMRPRRNAAEYQVFFISRRSPGGVGFNEAAA